MTTFDITQVRAMLAQCKPDESIDDSDPRYLKLKHADVEHELGWTEALYRTIQLNTDHSCQLFSGYVGTGKSTELKRLTRYLRGQGYLVMYADAEKYHNLIHPLKIEDLMIMVAAAIGDLTNEITGSFPGKTSYWDRCLNFLQTQVDLEKIRLPTGAANLQLAVKNSPEFWEKVRERISLSLGNLKEDTHDYIKLCLKLVKSHEREKYPHGVVFILDSLEKLRGSVEEFESTMSGVVTVYSTYRDMLRLPDCHTIYTVPPYTRFTSAVISSLYDRTLSPLPAVKIYKRHGDQPEPYRPGVVQLAKLIGKRLDLAEVFGVEDPETAEGPHWNALEKMILNSGGHVRTLIKMVRDVVTENAFASFPPAAELIDRVINKYREDAVLAVGPEGIPVLAEIHRTKSRENIAGEDLHQLAHYMDNQLVLCYQNGEGWFEIHPLIRDNVKHRARLMEDAKKRADTP